MEPEYVILVLEIRKEFMMAKPIHRQIMERHLGRELLKTEIVHHKDGDDHNNHLSNLELLNSHHEHLLKHKTIRINWDNALNELTAQYKARNDNEFQKSLDLFFTRRQQQIIYRKIVKNDLSKTETEMFSRSIKKKLRAIAHPSLYTLCQMFLCEL